ncbi:MAG: zinc ribbon domain-containing protein [Methanobacterium sp.]|nr:zinc ribbon domain-containing protein [Methanobacterium sp.]
MVVDDTDDDIIICNECKSENAKSNNYCLECGKPIHIEDTIIETVICTNCNREIEAGIKFCSACGAKIKDPKKTIATCPVCFVKLEPGLKFCTACGAEIKSKEKSELDEGTDEQNNEDEKENHKSEGEPIVDSMVNTGKDIMKGLDGILNKAASSLDTKGESKNTDKTRIKPKFKNDVHPGYLVCDQCGGYYELQAGETIEDFEECQCGGKLKHQKNI